jgi:undecaprenyl diphosphate synthase
MGDPNHIGFIVDGNRRWAKERNLPTFEGHRVGFEKVMAVTDWLLETDVKQVTYYLFSTENWKRSIEEVGYLMDLGAEMAQKLLDPWVKKNIRVFHIGEKKGLPEKVANALSTLEKSTRTNTGLIVNLAVNYGGKIEIVDAVNAILRERPNIQAISEEDISAHLYNPLSNPVDLIVRTSGEERISNFLIWQAAYSELIFLQKYWPDMEQEDVKFIREEFQRRQRRFGA